APQRTHWSEPQALASFLSHQHLTPRSWIILCHSAYGGVRRGVEGLEFTSNVGLGGLLDDFGDPVGGEFADTPADLVG
ncbi:MAG: hypothetical protein ACLP5J_17140, partial [Mycobacterium sp.]|uniref:hypothetical protein n=1 Tax=Mycobacterium sp. TaxID=1785 RepID=UPI003F9706D5